MWTTDSSCERDRVVHSGLDSSGAAVIQRSEPGLSCNIPDLVKWMNVKKPFPLLHNFWDKDGMLSQQLGSFRSLVPLAQGPAIGLLLYEGNDDDESFVRPWIQMPKSKASSWLCRCKGSGVGNAKCELGRQKSRLPCLEAALPRQGTFAEKTLPFLGPCCSCYPGLCDSRSRVGCYPWSWTVLVHSSSNSQPGCKSESMETLQRNVLVAKPCPGSADSVGLCIF